MGVFGMLSAAYKFDLATLLDSTAVEQVMPFGSVPTPGIYQSPEGVQFRTAGRNSQLVQEIVRVTEGAFLFLAVRRVAASAGR
jgi:hypothetical protein